MDVKKGKGVRLHVIKVYRRSSSIYPLILKLGTSAAALFLRKSVRYPLNRRLGRPQNRYGRDSNPG